MKRVGYIILTIEFKNIDRRWTAHCIELGTATFGRSLNEAKKKIEEAILLHLNTLEDVNERERFFKEHGIKFYPVKPKDRKIPVSVPLDEKTFIQTHLQPVPCLS
jgi:predicted RNase H-like HicB family nuclease